MAVCGVSPQFLLGVSGFFYPKFSKGAREALLPWHQFLGRATFVLGLATMAVRAQNSLYEVKSIEVLLHQPRSSPNEAARCAVPTHLSSTESVVAVLVRMGLAALMLK